RAGRAAGGRRTHARLHHGGRALGRRRARSRRGLRRDPSRQRNAGDHRSARPALPGRDRSRRDRPVIGTKLAILTGLYVGVVVTAQVSANKIVELPFTHLAAPAGTYLIGLALALIETAHHTAPTRREGWKNAQL